MVATNEVMRQVSLVITRFANHILAYKGSTPLSVVELQTIRHQTKTEPDELWQIVMLNGAEALVVRYFFTVRQNQLESEWLYAEILSNDPNKEEWTYLGQVWGHTLFCPYLAQRVPLSA